MPVFSDLPGTIAPDELEGRAEWVRPGEGFVRSVAVRLGSETQLDKLVLAALPPLGAWLAPDTYAAIVDDLPWGLRGMLRTPQSHLGGPVPRLEDRDAYVRFVAFHAQHPAARAALYVEALLAALRESLPQGLRDAVERELPPGLAGLWRDAR
jgi:uncharacterized protein (DUF2267 family)